MRAFATTWRARPCPSLRSHLDFDCYDRLDKVTLHDQKPASSSSSTSFYPAITSQYLANASLLKDMRKFFARLGLAHQPSDVASIASGDDLRSVYKSSYIESTADLKSNYTQRTDWTRESCETQKPQRVESNPVFSHPRLCLAFYARVKHPDSYHVALHLDLPADPATPGRERPTVIKYHCKNVLTRLARTDVNGTTGSSDAKTKVYDPSTTQVVEAWTYERKQLQLSETDGARDMWLLSRVLLGYMSPLALRPILQSVPTPENGLEINVSKDAASPVPQSLPGSELDFLLDGLYVPDPRRKCEGYTCVTWVDKAVRHLHYRNWITQIPAGSGKHDLEVSEDDGASWHPATQAPRVLPVQWGWDEVFNAGTKWVHGLRKENLAGIEVDGRLPEIEVNELLQLHEGSQQ